MFLGVWNLGLHVKGRTDWGCLRTRRWR
jgi:hypothetical protein